MKLEESKKMLERRVIVENWESWVEQGQVAVAE